MDEAEERVLARRLVRMDDQAWVVFCREYSVPLLTYVQLQFVCSRELAEEVVQRSFVRCVKSIRSFDPSQGRLFTWLKAIAKNEAHTALSAYPTRAEAESEGVSEAIERLDEAVLPDEIIAHKETQLMVHETLMELPSRNRKVLTLKYMENRRVAEIAKTLGQSEKAVESLLTRSRNAFKAMFCKKVYGSRTRESGCIDGI
jgi:RNA polymerase sigma factor (sigma-70 family)